jgi:hypothetical protein
LSWDIGSASASYLLIQAATEPSVTNVTPGTTATNIDSGILADGVANGVPGGAYNSWNVLDGVGILAPPLNPQDGGSYTQNGPDFSYAPITFQDTDDTAAGSNAHPGQTLPGSNVVVTSFTNSGTEEAANYVGRIDQNIGSSSAGWLASFVNTSAENSQYSLGTGSNTTNTSYSGEPLNNIGGPNDWAVQQTVYVNDGTSNQHSQVAELTITYSSPVTLSGTVASLPITSAVYNGSTAGTATITVSSTNVFAVGQPIAITGVTGTGWTGTKTITAVTPTTITFAHGSITGNGTVGGSSVAKGSVFSNIYTVVDSSGNSIPLSFVASGVNPQTTTGTETGVTSLVIRFLSSSDSFAFANATTLGSGLFGLSNGNYFLKTLSTQIKDAQGNELDGARDGTAGSPGNDEFWRLYGDALGTRTVDGLDVTYMQQAAAQTSVDTSPYWFMDSNMDNTINSTDVSAFNADYFTTLNP